MISTQSFKLDKIKYKELNWQPADVVQTPPQRLDELINALQDSGFAVQLSGDVHFGIPTGILVSIDGTQVSVIKYKFSHLARKLNLECYNPAEYYYQPVK